MKIDITKWGYQPFQETSISWYIQIDHHFNRGKRQLGNETTGLRDFGASENIGHSFTEFRRVTSMVLDRCLHYLHWQNPWECPPWPWPGINISCRFGRFRETASVFSGLPSQANYPWLGLQIILTEDFLKHNIPPKTHGTEKRSTQ